MSGGTLTGPEILRQISAGNIDVDPFDGSNINPASYDLTLGRQVQVYAAFTGTPHDTPRDIIIMNQGWGLRPTDPATSTMRLDPKNPGPAGDLVSFEIDDEGWWLMPGVCYLMHVRERIVTSKFVPIVDGKSSFGRLFIKVHFTAGWGDPGFDGQFTLEVMSQFPVKVYAHEPICQVRFQTLEGEVLSYQETGHYTGKAALGAVGSRFVTESSDE